MLANAFRGITPELLKQVLRQATPEMKDNNVISQAILIEVADLLVGLIARKQRDVCRVAIVKLGY